MSQFITIKLIPRSSENSIVGPMANGVLKIKLMAPPVDGAANEALIKFLSEEWNIPKSGITIARGHTSHHKIIAIADEFKAHLLHLSSTDYNA